jgi:hypothetical protein
MSANKFIHIAGHEPYICVNTINLIFSTYDKENSSYVIEILCDSNLENGRYEFKFSSLKSWQDTRKNILKQWTTYHHENDQENPNKFDHMNIQKLYLTLYDTEDKDEYDPTELESDDMKITEHLYVVDAITNKIQSISLTDVLMITMTCGAQIMIKDPTYFNTKKMSQFIEMISNETVIEC